MLELLLTVHLLCYQGECRPVVTGQDTKPGTYALTEYAVPDKDRKGYGSTWYQIGSDDNWGLHMYPNAGYWQSGKIKSHGCVRILKASDMEWIKSIKPTQLRIVR